MTSRIIFSHGSHSGPDSTKIRMLGAVAQELGCDVHAPDFRQDDTLGFAESVEPRIARLRTCIQASSVLPILVGSSMGAFVSGLASIDVPVAGLFLLATPASIPGCKRTFDASHGVPMCLIHGWRDAVCPWQGIHDFAHRRRESLLMLDDDHRLTHSLDLVRVQFCYFLEHLGAST